MAIQYVKRWRGPRVSLIRAARVAGFEPGDVVVIVARPGEIIIRAASPPSEAKQYIK